MTRVVTFERDGAYLRDRAGLNRRQGELLDALSLYRLALSRDPGDGAIPMDIAGTLSDMRCFAQSNRVIARQLAREEDAAACYFALAYNYAGQGMLDAAYQAIMHYVALDPKALERDDVRSFLLNALYMRHIAETFGGRRERRVMKLLAGANRMQRRGAYYAAGRFALRAYALNPHEEMIPFIAEICYKNGQYGRAAALLAPLLRAKTTPANVLAQSVRISVAQRKRAQAKETMCRLLALPRDEATLQALFEGLSALGDDQALAEPLAEALRKSPYDLEILALSAVQARRTSQAERADSLWRRILQIDPEHDLARYALDHPHGAYALCYDLQLPKRERKRRIGRLAAWQYAPPKDTAQAIAICRWGLRCGDRDATTLAEALLERLSGADADALRTEARCRPERVGEIRNISLYIRNRHESIAAMCEANAPARIPAAYRAAMRALADKGRALDILPTAIQLLFRGVGEGNLPWLRREQIDLAAAATAYAALRVRNRAIDGEKLSALFHCPIRRVSYMAHRLYGDVEQLMPSEGEGNAP